MKRLRFLVLGAAGQLGQCLYRFAQEENRWEDTFIFKDRQEVDLTNSLEVRAALEEYRPDFVLNASAYTAVDRAEQEEEKAYEINVLGVETLAGACKVFNAVLVHISTDYVFDGTSQLPYTEADWPQPLGIYGKTKQEGEECVQYSGCRYYILRTSWVFSEFGNNFVKTMLRLMKERPEIGVVADQVGRPTYGMDLARFMVRVARAGIPYGLYHLTGDGQASWFELASEVKRIASLSCLIKPLTTDEYPTPAARPKNSLLSNDLLYEKLGEIPRHWTWALQECLEKLGAASAAVPAASFSFPGHQLDRGPAHGRERG